MKPVRMRAAAATVGVAACGAVAVAALASPPSGFTPTNLVTEAEVPRRVHLNSDRITFKTKGPVDVRVQSVDIAPGGRSGWHHHPGLVFGAVQTGTVTFVDASCDTTVYRAGSVFIESGDEPHEARNLTNQPVTIYGTFIAPDADPGVFRIEDPVINCP
ncbi:MAG TPA: cupin domain-containing protein [Baekduia sp.]|nr:cupin domain-containing protein [Baekduia sp.]